MKAFNNNIAIDSLRGSAALSVLISHGDQGNLINIEGLHFIKGYLGLFVVDVFFIVSGYLIWISAKNALSHLQGFVVYSIHRATRLMPLYYFNIFLALFLLPTIGSHFLPSVSDGSIVRHITFTQALLPSVSREINPVLWTLTLEVVFYVIVPVLFAVIQKLKRVEYLLFLAGLLMLPKVYAHTGIFSPFFKVFYLFAIGIAVAEKCRSGLPFWLVFLSFVGIFGVLELEVSTEYCISVFAIAFFRVILSAASSSLGFINLVLMVVMKPIAWIGIASYSLYIWHYLLLNVMSFHSRAIVSWLQSIGLEAMWTSDLYRAMGIITSMVLISAVSYWAIERPSMGILRSSLMAMVRKQTNQTSHEVFVK